jgi:ABC-type lipoprotein release transport system permease subunit
VIITRVFWIDAAERAIKTVAQSAVAAIGVAQTPILDIDAGAILGVAATAGLVSLLTSIASASRRSTVSPASLVKD